MMFDTRIRYDGVRVRLRGLTIKRFQNVRILQAGLESIKFRVEKGIDSNEAKAKPLTKAYARRKSKITHRRAIRDLAFTGQLLSELKVRYADDNTAIADASTRMGRMKARIYRDMLIFSDGDQEKMRAVATKIFKQEVIPATFASFKVKPGRFQPRRLGAKAA